MQIFNKNRQRKFGGFFFFFLLISFLKFFLLISGFLFFFFCSNPLQHQGNLTRSVSSLWSTSITKPAAVSWILLWKQTFGKTWLFWSSARTFHVAHCRYFYLNLTKRWLCLGDLVFQRHPSSTMSAVKHKSINLCWVILFNYLKSKAFRGKPVPLLGFLIRHYFAV